MKARMFFFFLVSTLLFSACLIKSFQPFYLKDQVVKDDLIGGKYYDSDSSLWQFTHTVPQKTFFDSSPANSFYKLLLSEEDGKMSYFVATLFELNGELYLDLLPDMETLDGNELFSLHMLPVHSLAKVILMEEDAVLIKWYGEDWLNDLIKDGKLKIDHQKIKYDAGDEGTLVLTADTEELQKFITEFGNDPEAFDCEDKFGGDTSCRKLIKVK